MPADRNKQQRLIALDRCFSDQSQYYFIDDLIQACNAQLSRADASNPSISRRTVYNDINYMEGNHEWDVEFVEPAIIGGRRYYRYAKPGYSIFRNDLTETQLAELKSMLLMLRQFSDFPMYSEMEKIIHSLEDKYQFTLSDIDGVVSFEPNLNLDVFNHFSHIFSAIIAHRCIYVEHSPFNKPCRKILVHPYFLKQYSRRWYLVCMESSSGNIINLSLDRISSISPSSERFIPSDVNFEEDFFDDIIGVSNPPSDPEHVRLRFSQNRFPYVISKPLHASQRVISREERIVELFVKPNFELYQLLLSFGPDVEVLSPDSLISTISGLIKKMNTIYPLVQ